MSAPFLNGPSGLPPPVTRMRPSFNTVVVCQIRGSPIGSINVQVSAAGSYISAVALCCPTSSEPPIAITLPFASLIKPNFSLAWFMSATIVHSPVAGSQISVREVAFLWCAAPPETNTVPSSNSTAAGTDLQ